MNGALVFCVDDPRRDGCAAPVAEGVTVHFGEETWHEGAPRPPVREVVGRADADPSRYKLFATAGECRAEGYSPVRGRAFYVLRWSEYDPRALGLPG